MEKIFYFGQSKTDFRLLRNWLDESYQSFQATDPVGHLLENQNPDAPELILISIEHMSADEIDLLSQTVTRKTAAQLPQIILIGDQPPENHEISIPQELWDSETVDVLFKPLSKRVILKKINLNLKFKKSILASIQAEKNTRRFQHNKEVAEDRLKQSALENEVLLQEIHHRVKNNLQIVSSILSFKTEEIEDPKVQDILKIARSRVDAISLIHKQLYESNNLAKINMHEYIEQQVRDLFYNYPTRSNDIELTLDILPFTLEVTPAIHCALLINELILNVVLHAFPDGRAGELNISVKNHKYNQLRLIIEDNGIGIKENPEKMGSKSIGMRLIYQLVQQLNGIIHFHGNSGTCFEILFPKSP